jgi:hypothetical protein
LGRLFLEHWKTVCHDPRFLHFREASTNDMFILSSAGVNAVEAVLYVVNQCSVGLRRAMDSGRVLRLDYFRPEIEFGPPRPQAVADWLLARRY